MLATASLVSYAFYVPLSIMITPMLLEAPRQEDETGGHVTYLKLYLMSINVTKSIMLLVAVLGPQQVSTAVISSIVASFLLGTLTYAWFKSQDLLKSHYSAELQPCNIAFINFWKAASYTAAVTSAVAVVVAHSMQESVFSPQALTDSLIVAWSVIVATFVILYYRYYKQHFERQALVKELIKYPFVIRDARETDGKSVAQLSSPDILFRAGSLFEKGYKIPGFQISPWKDDVIRRKSPPAEEYGPESLSGVVIRSQIRKAQHINSSII